jgi:hypothetical protein
MEGFYLENINEGMGIPPAWQIPNQPFFVYKIDKLKQFLNTTRCFIGIFKCAIS